MDLPYSTILRGAAVAASLLALAACQNRPEPPQLIGTPAPALQPATGARDAAGRVTFAFEPFTGAPGNIADELSKEIGNEAGRAGIVLVRRVGASATYRVNGYLSAAGSPSMTTLFYVFDIVDANGTRLKRISGSEVSDGASGDPWGSAGSDALRRIAKRTVVEIGAWLNKGQS